MSNLYRKPAIDDSYQVLLHLAEGFQRRRLKCEKLTDDRQRKPSDGKRSHCLWQGELINWLIRIIVRRYDTTHIEYSAYKLSYVDTLQPIEK